MRRQPTCHIPIPVQTFVLTKHDAGCFFPSPSSLFFPPHLGEPQTVCWRRMVPESCRAAVIITQQIGQFPHRAPSSRMEIWCAGGNVNRVQLGFVACLFPARRLGRIPSPTPRSKETNDNPPSKVWNGQFENRWKITDTGSSRRRRR